MSPLSCISVPAARQGVFLIAAKPTGHRTMKVFVVFVVVVGGLLGDHGLKDQSTLICYKLGELYFHSLSPILLLKDVLLLYLLLLLEVALLILLLLLLQLQ